MIENKVFAGGGLNQDADNNFLKPNEWKDALNIRITDKLNGTDNVIVNIKGNTAVTYSLPSGTNKCIGEYANEQTGKYYSFIWNSLGNHSITEYDPSLNTIVKVLEANYLNFQEYELINGVGIVDGNLLYWTDGFNPPRGIMIDKAKTGTYYTDSVSISLAKQPPLQLISASYANDPNYPTIPVAINRLKGQLFQFRYLYVYEDGSRSAWSSCSQVPYPELEVNSSVSTEAYRNNNIVLDFNVGSKYVKSIEIAALVKGVGTIGTTQDWFVILSKDRASLISDPSFNYDSITNNCEYRFFNDGLYQSVDVLETDLPYDYVPLKSKCLDVINGNVLVLANNTEGYNNISTDVTLGVTYTAPNLSARISVVHPLTTTDYIFSGVPIAGDVINYDLDYYEPGGGPPAEPTLNITGSYTVAGLQTGNLNLTVNAISSKISFETGNAVIGTVTNQPDGTVLLSFATSPQVVAFGPADSMTITLAVSTLSASLSTYKTNSKYQFGLVYYDDFNRSTYVQTSDDFIVSTKSFGAVTGYNPAISWQINHSAPLWATSYQWVRTEQLTHKTSLFWLATSIAAPSGKDYYELDISSLITYNETNPGSILNYEYNPGDRVTIHKIGSTWQSSFDVAILGTEVNTTTFKIQIEKGLTLTPGTTDVLIEIYTPKTRSNQPTEQFFYEFGEVYSCTGGVHSTTSGSFTLGDVFFRNRIFNTTLSGTVAIEDLNFSDFYISNYSSNGRVNIFSPQAKQLNLPTDIRYSDTYVPNTNINGLSRFYGEAFETYDRVNGSIQKTAVRDNYLIVFQELKTGYIPIFQSIIEDQGTGNEANVAISNKILNKIRYFGGDYGIGKNPESMARFAGIIYFVDPNRGQVLKLTGGLQPISVIGMDSYFTNKLTSIKSISNAKVLGSYDPYNDEYLITFKLSTAPNALDQTIVFSELINRWTSFYSFIPDFGGYIFNQYITHKNGTLYTHNNNSSYGTFYGTNYESYVDLVFNSSATLIKTFLGFIEQSNTRWTPTVISTSNSQISELVDADLSEKEDVFFASFLRDSSSPGGLLNGDDLKGNWIRLKLVENNRTKATLFSADVRFIPSYQGIK